MKMPSDEGSIKRNALQRLRDSYSNKLLDAEALQSNMERDNPMLAQIREGAVSGGMAPVAGSAGILGGSSKELAKAVGGKVMGGTGSAPYGAIIKDAAMPLVDEATTMAANAKPRLNTAKLLEAIKARFGNKLVQ